MRRTRAISILLALLLLAGCERGGTAGPLYGGTSNGGNGPASSAASGTATTGASAGSTSTTSAASGLSTVTIRTSSGKKVEVRVEIADTEAERERGLMGRTAMGEDHGMLFIFYQNPIPPFWMKDTLIPLSIAFISSGGRIVDIQDMQPQSLTNHYSAAPARYALEVNQGFFRERGVQVGDRVELPR